MNDSDVKYKRIDSDISDILKGDGTAVENAALTTLFREAVGNEKLEVEFEMLKDDSVPALLTLSEESRRMEDMMKMYASMGMGMGEMPLEYTLVLNASSPLINKLSAIIESDNDKAKLIASEIYRLALISQRHMTADEMKAFLSDSFKIMGML
jgi:molecular chaperone HtpG